MKQILENLSNTKELTNDKERIRLGIMAEMDAINLYKQLAEKADDNRVKDILNHVAEEEKHHVAEFLYLLNLLDDEQVKANKDGKQEAKNVIKKGL
jgi:rubrerythrin